MKSIKSSILLLLFIIAFGACSDNKSGSSVESVEEKELVKAPPLNADSAYYFVQKQVDFGPRIPNSQAHREAADYFVSKLESYGANVIVQEFEDQVYDGTTVQLKNIIASFNPDKQKRILLAAHWDTRPFADKNEDDKYEQFDGANDGASGVGVLLEVARVISQNEGPNVGVDIILFDGEDWGEHLEEGYHETGDKDSWYCLGSQYWSKNKHRSNYSAYYGILLDMVGAPDATFYQEGYSKSNAKRVLDKTWQRAHDLGYGRYFVYKDSEPITDDHKYVNQIARIPMIDIIDYKEGTTFGTYHHTSKDNMEVIDRNTLKAVGEVLLSLLYNE